MNSSCLVLCICPRLFILYSVWSMMGLQWNILVFTNIFPQSKVCGNWISIASFLCKLLFFKYIFRGFWWRRWNAITLSLCPRYALNCIFYVHCLLSVKSSFWISVEMGFLSCFQQEVSSYFQLKYKINYHLYTVQRHKFPIQ